MFHSPPRSSRLAGQAAALILARDFCHEQVSGVFPAVQHELYQRGLKVTQELQALLERINQDGVEKAESERERIVGEAEAEAEKTVERARQEAEKIVGQARNEAELLVRKGEESLRQAGRDLLLSLREQLQKRLAAVVKACVVADADAKAFAEAIAKAVGRQFEDDSVSELEVMVPRKDRETMEKHIFAALDKDLRKNVTITPMPELESGFRLRFDKDDVLYDFSDAALADSLMVFLGPRLAEILAAAEDGESGDPVRDGEKDKGKKAKDERAKNE